jgi:hypothetical protein
VPALACIGPVRFPAIQTAIRCRLGAAQTYLISSSATAKIAAKAPSVALNTIHLTSARVGSRATCSQESRFEVVNSGGNGPNANNLTDRASGRDANPIPSLGLPVRPAKPRQRGLS